MLKVAECLGMKRLLGEWLASGYRERKEEYKCIFLKLEAKRKVN